MQNEADFLEKQFDREFSNLLDKDIQLQNYNEIERLRIELNSHLTKSSSEKKTFGIFKSEMNRSSPISIFSFKMFKMSPLIWSLTSGFVLHIEKPSNFDYKG